MRRSWLRHRLDWQHAEQRTSGKRLTVAMLRKLNEKFHSYVREIVFISRDCARWHRRIKLFANTVLFHFENWARKTARREDVIFSANIRIGSVETCIELRRFAGDIFVLYEVLCGKVLFHSFV